MPKPTPLDAMSAVELEAHIKAVDKEHKETLKPLKALLRAKVAEEARLAKKAADESQTASE